MPSTFSTKRLPWLAALLSLLMPGLGQLYCGAFVRCLVFLIAASGTGLLGLVALVPRLALDAPAVITIQLVSVLMYVAGAIDAFVVARRTRADYGLKDYNRWYAYVMFYVAVSAGHLFSTLYARDHLIQPFKAGSNSMFPSIGAGDQVLASKQAYVEREPAPGDIVTFYSPQDRSQIFVKRVVAVGGDTIEIRAGEVYVNDAKLQRESIPVPEHLPEHAPQGGAYYREVNRGARYVTYFGGKDLAPRNFPKTTVPPYHSFVLGDNRDTSLDSRTFGPLPNIAVTGRVGFMYAPLRRLGAIGPGTP